MAKSNKKDTGKAKDTAVVEFDNLPTKLKEIAKKGEDGQYITLVDIEETKTILTNLSEKHKDLSITKDNYKKEGAIAEKELRQTRYALQRIHKSNNSFLLEIKNAEKETYEGLIDLIKPQEKRLYDEINAFKEQAKKEKEAEAKAEKERVERIENALKEAEFAMEKAVIQGKTQEDVKKYDEFLKDFEGRFADFEEMEFQAKRLHAIYTAKRNKLVEQVTAQEALEKQIKENADKEAKRAEQKEKIYKLREKYLSEKGLSCVGKKFVGFGIELEASDIKEKDEVEWLELQDELGVKIEKAKQKAEKDAKDAKEKREKEERDALIQTRENWDKLVIIYEGLGGDPKIWKLKKNEIPSQKDIDKLTQATRELQANKKALLIKEVKKEIKPFEEEANKFVFVLEGMIGNRDFKNAESGVIVENFKGKIKDLIKESFSEVTEKG